MSALKQDKDIYSKNIFSILSSESEEIDEVSLPSEETLSVLSSIFSIKEVEVPIGDTTSSSNREVGDSTSSSNREEEMEFYSDYKMSEHLQDIHILKGRIPLPLQFYCDQRNGCWIIYAIGYGEYKAKYYEKIFSDVNNDKKFTLTFLNSRGLYGWIQTMINEWDSRGDGRNTYMLKFIGSSSCKIYRSGYKREILLDINYFLDTYLSNILISN